MYLRNCFVFLSDLAIGTVFYPTLTIKIGSYIICTAIEGIIVHVFTELFCFSFRPGPDDVSFYPTHILIIFVWLFKGIKTYFYGTVLLFF